MPNRISIVISNRDRFDIESNSTIWFINSLKNQEFKYFELNIVDGGSKNINQVKKFAQFFNDFQINIIKTKMGDLFERAYLNNVGVRNSNFDYILCTDADMFFAPYFLKDVNNVLNKNNFVESRTMYWRHKMTNMIYKNKIDPFNNLDRLKKGRIKQRTTAGGCQCAHIDVWNKVCGYNEDMKGWGGEDIELLERVMVHGYPVVWLGEDSKTIGLFHQPHKKDCAKNVEEFEENKKIMLKSKKNLYNEEWGKIRCNTEITSY